MSRKYPVLTAKQLVRILELKGFLFSRQKGSHAIYRNDAGLRTTVPIHGKKNLGTGLLRQIMNDTGLTNEDLENA